MDRSDAEEYTRGLELIGEGWWRQIALAVRLGVPEALGLSRSDWRAQLGSTVKITLEIPERRDAVLELAAEGMSQRAIGDVLGVDHRTVGHDLEVVGEDSPPAQSIVCDDGPSLEVVGEDSPPARRIPSVMLHTHEGVAVEYPEPRNRPTFNETKGDGISWARWSWNPVTGCLHGCNYCYARDIATNPRYAESYPVGFTPLFHHERLDAPAWTRIPKRYDDDSAATAEEKAAWRRVFVCSMADLYGRWVPADWINQVHASMLANPQWEYLLLTKFPSRYSKVELPPNAWVGTSVDEQRRVRIAEEAFRKIDGVKVKWLSLEPLRTPLKFSDFSMFDWVVIGAQTATNQPDGAVPAFSPPAEWVVDITYEARAAGCKVHWKDNLRRDPGMQLLDEYPI